MTNPLGYQTTYAYNAADLLTSTTDADGRTIDYGYDAIGEKTSETWVGGNYTATYQYNAAGQLTEASDPFSTYTYTYDADGHLTSVSNAGTPAVPTVTLSYGYDAFGDRTSLTDSLGGQISYSYDGDLRLSSLGLSVSGTLDAQVTFGYDAASRLTGVTRSSPVGYNISASLSYDNANELTSITYSLANMTMTLARYSYGYNAGGELTSYQDNNSSSLTYGYDANGELTSASGTLNGSSYSVSYSYDANGNRTMAGYQTGTGNELLSDGTYNYTYDKDGNTLTQTNISTGSVTYYTWDYRNRLVEVKQETSTGTVINDEKFTYDVTNNRIAVSLNGTTQLYTVYDGSNPYIDFNGSGTLTERYLTNPNALSQLYGQVNGSGTVQWFLTDNINSIREVVSTSGSVLDAITYDPYGNILSQTNSGNAPRFLYAGGTFDQIADTNGFGNRQESPQNGRWTSQDPLGFKAGDTNLYRYVLNAPTYESGNRSLPCE
jgi:RHS repeat-associated protein